MRFKVKKCYWCKEGYKYLKVHTRRCVVYKKARTLDDFYKYYYAPQIAAFVPKSATYELFFEQYEPPGEKYKTPVVLSES